MTEKEINIMLPIEIIDGPVILINMKLITDKSIPHGKEVLFLWKNRRTE